MSDREHARRPAGMERRRFLTGAAAAAAALAAGATGAPPASAARLEPPGTVQFAVDPGKFVAQALAYLAGPVQRIIATAPEAALAGSDGPRTVRMAGGFSVAVGDGYANAAKRLLSIALRPTEVAFDGTDPALGAIRLRLDPTRPAPSSALQSLDPTWFFDTFADPANRDPVDPAATYDNLFATFFPASVTVVFDAVVTIAGMPGTELVNRDPVALGDPSVPWFPPSGEGYTILNAPVELVPRHNRTGGAVAVIERFPVVVDFEPGAPPAGPRPPVRH